MTRAALGLLCALALWPPVARAEDTAALDNFFARAVITVEGRAACHRLGVYLALSPEQRARGLMFVTDLPEDEGMLFIYPGPRRVSMWMKNTLISLDMVFIRQDGVVARVEEDTVPLSLETIPAGEPVDAVLELNAGAAAALGIAAGRRIWRPETGI